MSWSDDWTKVDANSGADYDYVLLRAQTDGGGEVSLQFNALERPWKSVEEAEEFGLDSWIASFGGSKEIEEIIETWISDEAAGFVFREDWSGEVSIQYVEFAQSDGADFWRQVMLKVEDVEDGELEELLESIEVDSGPVLLAADLDEISEGLVDAVDGQ